MKNLAFKIRDYLFYKKVKTMILFLYIGINLYLFLNGFQYNSNETINIFSRIAKGASACINFNGALIFIPMMRTTFTWLRRSFLRNYIPIDRTHSFHIFVGHFLYALSVLHVVGYLLYYATLSEPFMNTLLGTKPDLSRTVRTSMYEFVTKESWVEEIETWVEAGAPETQYHETIQPILQEDCTKCHSKSSTMTYGIPRIPLTTYEEVKEWTTTGTTWGTISYMSKLNLTGLLLLALFTVMWVCSLKVIRKHRHNLFYFTHFLYFGWVILAILHGPTFWQWVILPFAGILVEWVFRRLRGQEESYISESEITAPNIAHIKIRRPNSFQYRPGDYLFLRVPGISRLEWHPFTIASTGNDREIRLYIKDLGDWTNALIEKLVPPKEADIHKSDSLQLPVQIHGPYGAPAVHVLDSEIALLIGTGIGATPFASVLQTVLEAYRENRMEQLKLKKLHFVWICREISSFEWLTELLSELESVIAGSEFLNIQLFMTGANEGQKDGDHTRSPDLLKNRLTYGRPDWSRLFKQVADQHPTERVDTYYCGPESLAKELKKSSRKFKFSFRKEIF